MTTYIFLGDSLTHGYGVPEGQGWVDLLAHDLALRALVWKIMGKMGIPFKVCIIV